MELYYRDGVASVARARWRYSGLLRSGCERFGQEKSLAMKTLAFVCVLQLCVAVVFGAAGDTGDACVTTQGQDPCKSANDVCEDDKC
ncbi:hypothetical protein BaRGS_00017953, partial [Batillaria attramentaria]